MYISMYFSYRLLFNKGPPNLVAWNYLDLLFFTILWVVWEVLLLHMVLIPWLHWPELRWTPLPFSTSCLILAGITALPPASQDFLKAWQLGSRSEYNKKTDLKHRHLSKPYLDRASLKSHWQRQTRGSGQGHCGRDYTRPWILGRLLPGRALSTTM